ncbi:luciferase family protein YtmO [Klebsiella pneumoniae]|uniref:Luciferase family protein YtmO n=1 Tax=Klebsiella pneumoniae TaxID=573 RepID=A0A377ZYD6_KLEPN|nr:luciferase family protein YtmO [Klebsiella pneumoniae]
MATARCAVPCSTAGARLNPREAMVAVQVVVADDSATAAALAQQVEVWGVELENRPAGDRRQ